MNKTRLLSFLLPSLIILSSVAIGAFILFGQKLPRDYAEIRKEGVLRVVTEYNQVGYYVEEDTIRGFQYDLIKEISALSGLPVEISLEMGLPESFRGLEERKYDVIVRNIPITTELKRDFSFTDRIIYNKQVLVQRTEVANDGVAPIRNQLDLAGKTLYVPEDSPSILRIQNFESEIGDSIFVVEHPQYSTEQLIIMVAKGEIDYAVCDLQLTLTYIKDFPEIDIETDIGFTQLESWALRKESYVLLDSLNHWLNKMRDNGSYEKIYSRYFR